MRNFFNLPFLILFYIFKFKTLTYLVVLWVYTNKSIVCYTEK